MKIHKRVIIGIVVAIVAIVAALLIIFFSGGDKSNDDPARENSNLIQELPAIETAVQKDYTAKEILSMYNNALSKIEKAQSYHMYGSWNSTSVYGGILSSVVNTLDFKYRLAEGKALSFYESSLNGDGTDYSHTTYYDGELYYYNYAGYQYYTDSNGYQDYAATDWLKPIGDDVTLQNLSFMDQLDGSVEISFSVLMGEYMSDAVLDIIGFNSETFEQDLVHLSFTVEQDGSISYFYISYTSVQKFMDEDTEQTIIASMSIDGYDTTTFEIPTGLDSYENWIEEGSDEEFEGVGNLSPEDVS